MDTQSVIKILFEEIRKHEHLLDSPPTITQMVFFQIPLKRTGGGLKKTLSSFNFSFPPTDFGGKWRFRLPRRTRPTNVHLANASLTALESNLELSLLIKRSVITPTSYSSFQHKT